MNKVLREYNCPWCKGTGNILLIGKGRVDCMNCKGVGKVLGEKRGRKKNEK